MRRAAWPVLAAGVALAGAAALASAQPSTLPESAASPSQAVALDGRPVPESTRRWRSAAIVAAAVGGTMAYGRAKWWQDGFGGGFKTVDEGWFGQHTDYGGADKLGHAMFAYAGTRLAADAFRWAGHDDDRARRLGVATAVGTLLAVELADGWSRKWRFSKEDAVADLVGGALGWWLESRPDVDAWLDLRLQYRPSTGPEGRRSFDPFGDYSGQRYLAVFKPAGVPALRAKPGLRWLEFSVGYGTRDFEPESRALATPTRRVVVGVALNLTELLRATAFAGAASPSRTQRWSETVLEYVQLPVGVQAGRVIR